ncbi:MAG TPA: acyltransferase family protein [Terracidiphilus sp.]|nr:acyltransferase family protein [Terracidiphilus sp.]
MRTVMTALVILHHTAITYGAVGGWFWNELKPSDAPSSLLLTLLCATNQASFMGFFFLLAGCFTPSSLERNGYARFIGDRFLRLGLPLLAFGFVLGPLIEAMVTFAEGRGFWSTFVWLWNHKVFGNDPLWFVQALLMFSLAYCLWRVFLGMRFSNAQPTLRPVPTSRWWLACALGVGAAALASDRLSPQARMSSDWNSGTSRAISFFFDWESLLGVMTGFASWPGNTPAPGSS